MLVLSRKQGEQICIGEGVTLTVVSVHGDRVRLGIQAPREVTVDRQEIRQRKIEEQSEWESQGHRLITEVA
ncbi:Carbon storage regulator [Planctopirus ephydatiae]|uniref:Translational regulator CsrA n=1 Tax=Planctopirus ephydatiae TaxID=2528019 RepID=A0A518GP85_9PLAN|nr:carbon storage regulator CsrA [Planctopirus ephydatiae]QDV30281.1 Carbon storage regulator [Planctopirus ephydatiae]